MNNNNTRSGDLWNPPTQSIRFASNSTSNSRNQGAPLGLEGSFLR